MLQVSVHLRRGVFLDPQFCPWSLVFVTASRQPLMGSAWPTSASPPVIAGGGVGGWGGSVPIGCPGPHACPTCLCPRDGDQFPTRIMLSLKEMSLARAPSLRVSAGEGGGLLPGKPAQLSLARTPVNLTLLLPRHTLTGRVSFPRASSKTSRGTSCSLLRPRMGLRPVSPWRSTRR